MNEIRKPDIRELALHNGMDYPNDEELVMMILGSGIKKHPVRNLARIVNDIVDESFGDELIEKLKRIKGVGNNRALQVAAAVEYGRRKNSFAGMKVTSPSDVIPFVQTYAIKPREHFLCITLNGNREIIQIHVMSVGSISSSVVYPREIYTTALLDGAAALILCHNHPSGNTSPSKADIETTRQIMRASEFLAIPVLDHIIINCTGFFSFKEHDLLFTEDE